MTKTSKTLDFDAIRAKRIAMVETATELQLAEQAAIPLAAEYLTGPDVEAFLAKLSDFESVSQLNSPFVQQLANTRATVEHLRNHITSAATLIEQQQAREAAAAAIPPAV